MVLGVRPLAVGANKTMLVVTSHALASAVLMVITGFSYLSCAFMERVMPAVFRAPFMRPFVVPACVSVPFVFLTHRSGRLRFDDLALRSWALEHGGRGDQRS